MSEVVFRGLGETLKALVGLQLQGAVLDAGCFWMWIREC